MAADLPSGLEMPSPWYVLAWALDNDHRGAGAAVPGLPGLLIGIDGSPAWEDWSEPRYAALSLLKQINPGDTTPPWHRWLLEGLLKRGEAVTLAEGDGINTVERFHSWLMNSYSARAARLIPLLTEVEPEGWRQERVTGMLVDWDFRIGDNNREAPFFVTYQLELARSAFGDELGEPLFAAFVADSDRYQSALDEILEEPDNEWWDDVRTPQRETRDDQLRSAYEPALECIGRNYGDLHMLWEWDILHANHLQHPLGTAWPWDQLFSRKLQPDGWADTNNASPGGLGRTGGICFGGDLFRTRAVFGYRQIADARDPDALWFLLLPGQSGHPLHPHYDDLTKDWHQGRYRRLESAPSPEEVVDAQNRLLLLPADTTDAD
jgi:penicillin amidase